MIKILAFVQSHQELLVYVTTALDFPQGKGVSFSSRISQLLVLGLPRENSGKVNFQALLALRDRLSQGKFSKECHKSPVLEQNTPIQGNFTTINSWKLLFWITVIVSHTASYAKPVVKLGF